MQKFSVQPDNPNVVNTVKDANAKREAADPNYKPPVQGSVSEALGREQVGTMQDTVSK